MTLQAFDELLLMKRGGRIIYFGPLGHHSDQLIEYFEASTGLRCYWQTRPVMCVIRRA